MRRFLLLIGCLAATALHAQSAYCPAADCACIHAKAEAAFAAGDFELAVNKYQAWKTCDPNHAQEADKLVIQVFQKIEGLKNIADSIASAAQQAAHTAYANDLAFKSQIALKNGDLTTAYRLSEFGYRYVDHDNFKIKSALTDAFWYNHSHLPHAWSINTYKLDVPYIGCIAISPDGNKLAIKSYKRLIIWGLDNRKIMFNIEDLYTNASSLSFSPNGEKLAIADFNKTIKIWNLEDVKAILTLEIPITEDTIGNSHISCLTFSPDGKKLVTVSSDNSIRIYDAKGGQMLPMLQNPSYDKASLLSTAYIAFSPDGKKLAIASISSALRAVKVWDLDSNKVLFTLQDLTNCLAFSPDGKKLATASYDNKIKIWNLDDGNISQTLVGHTLNVTCLAFSSDGKRLASGSSDKTARIWDLKNGTTNLILEGHEAGILNLSFSTDRQKLTTVSLDYTIKSWALDSIKTLIPHKDQIAYIHVAFSPDLKKLVTISFPQSKTEIWDLSTRKASPIYEGFEGFEFNKVAFSFDGKLLATGFRDKTVKIWDLEDSKALMSLPHNSCKYCNVEPVSFSGDGKKLITQSGGGIKFWNLYNEKPYFSLETVIHDIISADLSYDGKRLAVASGKTVTILNTDSLHSKYYSKLISSDNDSMLISNAILFIIKRYTSDIRRVVFSPEGNKIAIASMNDTVVVWDLENGKSLQILGYRGIISDVAFSPDGCQIAIGYLDNSIKIWDLESGKIIFTIHEGGNRKFTFSPDGKELSTINSEAKIWELDTDNIIHKFKAEHFLTLLTPTLSFSQLELYNLETLLDQYPENERKLIATGEIWQITAFAELAANQAQGSNVLARVEPLYARADRLYSAALALQDELYIHQKQQEMLKNWAQVYRENGLEEKAAALEKRANQDR